MFSKLITTPLTSIHNEVLIAIRRKKNVQYPSPLNNYLNTLNLNKSCLFYHGYKHDTKNYYTLKKDRKINPIFYKEGNTT